MKKRTQFKANFRKAAMFLNFYLTKDYENVPLRRRGKNKPNQTQFTKCPQAWGAKHDGNFVLDITDNYLVSFYWQ